MIISKVTKNPGLHTLCRRLNIFLKNLKEGGVKLDPPPPTPAPAVLGLRFFHSLL